MQTKEDHDKWVRTFFKGSFLVQGWESQSNELLSRIDGDRQAIEKKLAELGALIAGEWAKENQSRKIDSADLQRWGTLMAAAAREGRAELTEALEKIGAETIERIGS